MARSYKFCDCKSLIVGDDVTDRRRCDRLIKDAEIDYCEVINAVWGLKNLISGQYMGKCGLQFKSLGEIRTNINNFLGR